MLFSMAHKVKFESNTLFFKDEMDAADSVATQHYFFFSQYFKISKYY